MFKIKTILFFILSLLFVTAQAEQSPAALLEERTNQALKELNQDDGIVRKDLDKLYEMVDRLVFPLVDFESMGKLILGKHWKRAKPEQREHFINAFTNLLKHTYTKSLKQYANQSIRYFPSKTLIKDKYASVYSEFVPGSGQPNVAVVYKLRKKGAGSWKVYDLVIENLSVVKNYRTDYNREISATSLDSLIARLEKEQEKQRLLAEEEGGKAADDKADSENKGKAVQGS